ncbi:hypothetical protein WR25_26261 [Diploscapter pachys]|uniref:Uncharacterized protein n=1 Tax=Diploscapter pachys TaxID=2018661 RepID=A0A2A2JSQ7_9BILA|nr:hypothetical protein WR25_26261 [Diploscapter pachys]
MRRRGSDSSDYDRHDDEGPSEPGRRRDSDCDDRAFDHRMHNLYRALSKNNQPDELKKLVDNLEESGISQREMVERMIELADIEHAIDDPDLSTEQEPNQEEIPEDEEPSEAEQNFKATMRRLLRRRKFSGNKNKNQNQKKTTLLLKFDEVIEYLLTRMNDQWRNLAYAKVTFLTKNNWDAYLNFAIALSVFLFSVGATDKYLPYCSILSVVSVLVAISSFFSLADSNDKYALFSVIANLFSWYLSLKLNI